MRLQPISTALTTGQVLFDLLLPEADELLLEADEQRIGGREALFHAASVLLVIVACYALHWLTA